LESFEQFANASVKALHVAEAKRLPSVGRSSFLLGSGTLVSRVLGFVKTIILAQTLGIVGSAGADSFAVANQLPSSIYVIIAGGVLTATLVPAIVKSALHRDGGVAYINKLMTMALVVLLVVTLVATLAAPWLVALFAASWSTQQLALASAFAYWCLPQIFFYGLYTVLGEVLNARGSFGPFTWAPVLNNIVALLGVIVFMVIFGTDTGGERSITDWTPGMVNLLAGSATLGVAAQAVILTYFWRRLGLGFRPDFVWKGVGLRETGRVAGWTFGIVLVTQLGGIIETNVVSQASGVGASVFTLATAWLIFMLPHSIIAVSLGTVYFTRMSEHAATKKLSAVEADTSEALRNIGLLIVWAAAGLACVAYPVSTLFAGQGFFAISGLASLIQILVIGLPAFSALYVIFRVFLALGQARVLFNLTLLQVGLFCALALASSLLPLDMIAQGVAGSLTLSILVQAIVAYALLRRRLSALDTRRLRITAFRSYFAGGVATLGGMIAGAVLGAYSEDGFALSSLVGALIAMVCIGLTVTTFYALVLGLMRTPELGAVVRMVRLRVGR
jgi:putative peptidoglycan lipid II flippase